MARYVVAGQVTISVHTVVEAKSKAAAKREAQSRGVQGLCHYCASRDSGEEWVTSGELDGEPKITEIEAMQPEGDDNG